MTQKDLFQAAVRAAGLIVFLYGVEAMYEALMFSAGASDINDPRLAKMYGLRGVLEIALGLYFVRGASPFVAFAFPPDPAPQP